MQPRSNRDQDILAAIRAVATADTSDFLELVRIAGLDKKVDFKDADLSEMDLAGLDLRGFNFEGTLFHNADLRNTRLEGTGFSPENAIGAKLEADRDISDLPMPRLSLEGEVAIAKRIEASKFLMALSAVQSAVTSPTILDWCVTLLTSRAVRLELIDVGQASALRKATRRSAYIHFPRSLRVKVVDEIIDAYFFGADGQPGAATREVLKARLRDVRAVVRVSKELKGLREARVNAKVADKNLGPRAEKMYAEQIESLGSYMFNASFRDARLSELRSRLNAAQRELNKIESQLINFAEQKGFTRREFLTLYRNRETELRSLILKSKKTDKRYRALAGLVSSKSTGILSELENFARGTGQSILEFRATVRLAKKANREYRRAFGEMYAANEHLVARAISLIRGRDEEIQSEFSAAAEMGLNLAIETFDYRDNEDFSSWATPIISKAIEALDSALGS